MGALRPLILGLHILAGSTGLLAAPVALLTPKGGRAHRRSGTVFFWSMVIVASSAAMLVLFFGSNVFLLLVAILSAYLAFKGVRAVRRKSSAPNAVGALDWAAAALALLAGGGLILVALDPARYHLARSFSPVAAVFAVVLILTAAAEMRGFVTPRVDPQAWWFAHMTGMLAAYISFVTAFSTVNFTFLPSAVRWLWPTVVGTPGIALWVTHYRRRFRRRTPHGETQQSAPPGLARSPQPRS